MMERWEKFLRETLGDRYIPPNTPRKTQGRKAGDKQNGKKEKRKR